MDSAGRTVLNHWEFKLSVITPEGLELVYQTTYAKGYMDKTMISNGFYRMADAVGRELDARDELE